MKQKKTLVETDYSRLASFILRVGLAIPFLYAAIAATLDPLAWIGFMPLFLRNLLPETLLMWGFSAYELGLALWLLSGWKTKDAACLSALTLLAVVLTNLGALDIIFRDIGLIIAAVSLALLHYKK